MEKMKAKENKRIGKPLSIEIPKNLSKKKRNNIFYFNFYLASIFFYIIFTSSLLFLSSLSSLSPSSSSSSSFSSPYFFVCFLFFFETSIQYRQNFYPSSLAERKKHETSFSSATLSNPTLISVTDLLKHLKKMVFQC